MIVLIARSMLAERVRVHGPGYESLLMSASTGERDGMISIDTTSHAYRLLKARYRKPANIPDTYDPKDHALDSKGTEGCNC